MATTSVLDIGLLWKNELKLFLRNYNHGWTQTVQECSLDDALQS